MIKIDPARHLDITAGIIQNKYLGIIVLVLALGIKIPLLGSVLSLLIPLFLYVFPFYLFFTLIINSKMKWAVVLLIGMVFCFLIAGLNFTSEYLQSLLGYLPLLFLVIYCFILNLELKEWGYRQEKEKSPLWF
ncbi:MAG TPA: hypothetical protein VF181_03310 [Balneolaceae bacterium]